MKKSLYIVFLFVPWMLFQTACYKATEDPVRPLSIQAFLPASVNTIRAITADPEAGFLILSDHGKFGSTVIYRFSDALLLLDSSRIPFFHVSPPAFDEEGNFYLVGGDPLNGYDAIIKVGKDLKVIGSRSLDDVAPILPMFRYNSRIVRVNDGSYVIAYTDNQESPQQNKIVMLGLNNPLEDTDAAWISNPSYNSEWIQELFLSQDGSLLVTGYDHDNVNFAFISKYTPQGIRYWRKVLPFDGLTYQAAEMGGKIYCSHLFQFYRLDQDGKTDKIYWHARDYEYNAVSNFISNGDYLYYGKDHLNTDGYFFKLYKLNADMEPLDSAIYGSRGTNRNTNDEFNRRYMLKLANGTMLAIVSIEKPGLNGNNWLLFRFDDDLDLVE